MVSSRVVQAKPSRAPSTASKRPRSAAVKSIPPSGRKAADMTTIRPAPRVVHPAPAGSQKALDQEFPPSAVLKVLSPACRIMRSGSAGLNAAGQRGLIWS